MTNLNDLRILDILPGRISDEYMEALDYALTPELQEITAAIIETIIMPRIDEQDEPLVDLLAWQLHVDFYEPLGLNLDLKRALVKNSLIWHRYKGTKYVVEEIVRTLFFPDFRVEEWFEYGGKPYFFRAVVGSQPTSSAEVLGEAIKAIYATKNERSWLEYIRFEQEIPTNTYVGGAFEESTYELFAMADLPAEFSHTPYMLSALAEHVWEQFGGYSPPAEFDTPHSLAVAMCEHIKEEF